MSHKSDSEPDLQAGGCRKLVFNSDDEMSEAEAGWLMPLEGLFF